MCRPAVTTPPETFTLRVPSDPLIDRLVREGVAFSRATDEVIEGFDLESTGNRSYGKNVHVASRKGPTFPAAKLRLGRSLAVGHREAYRGCELRCEREGKAITVRLYGEDGAPMTRTLAHVTGDDEVDEGLLTWFGPIEHIGTPWNDNDDEQCQVITVEVLRDYAGSVWARRRLARVEARMVQVMTASLTWPDFSEDDAAKLPEAERVWYLPLVRFGASINRRAAKDFATFCQRALRGSDSAPLRALLRTRPGMSADELEAVVSEELTRSYSARSGIEPLTELLGWILRTDP